MGQKQLGQYIVEEQIGEGSFARVYRARDLDLQREVALKVLKPAWMSDRTAIQRFKQEARTMAKLDSNPHIAVVYGVGESEGEVYLAQKLVDGESLAERLARGPLSWPEISNILRPIASALDYAHNQGVIHRDIKPSNILLDKDGHAFLGDFGLVRAAEGSESLSASIGGVKGTASYISPEIWDGKEATPATDVYALSCVICEMITGDVLFEGSSMMQVMRLHDKGPQFPDTWPEGVPAGVTEVFRRGLAADPKERIQRAGELVAALEALGGVPVSRVEKEHPTILQPSPGEEPTMWLVASDGQRHGLQKGSTTLGRAANADIQIDSPSVSRRHATLEFDGQNCTVYDDGSANGTFINGKRVSAEGTAFKPGDRLKIGETLFSLSTSVTGAPPPPVQPSKPQADERVDTTVVSAPEAASGPPLAPPVTPPPVTPEPEPAPQPVAQPAAAGGMSKGFLLGGAIVVLAIVVLVIGGAAIYFTVGPTSIGSELTDTPTPTLEPNIPTPTPEPDTPAPTLEPDIPLPTLEPDTPTPTPEPDTPTPTLEPDVPTPTPIPSTPTPLPPTPTPIPPTPTEIPPQPVLNWISIPGGSFTMGSSDADIQAAVADCNQYEGNCQAAWFGSESPQRTESTGAFAITKYEITNAQYNACVNAGVCRSPQKISSDNSVPFSPSFFADNFPVVTITVADASNFCTWVGGRLPSEREWEKAARGTDGRRYPWGNSLEPYTSRANLFSSGPTSVGSYPSGASPYADGVMDMAGNVAEFTSDNVVRGGSWKSFPHHGRTTQRSTGAWLTSNFVNFDIGFRCIR